MCNVSSVKALAAFWLVVEQMIAWVVPSKVPSHRGSHHCNWIRNANASLFSTSELIAILTHYSSAFRLIHHADTGPSSPKFSLNVTDAMRRPRIPSLVPFLICPLSHTSETSQRLHFRDQVRFTKAPKSRPGP